MNQSKLSSTLTLIKCCLCYGCALGLVSNCFGIFFSPVAEDLALSVGSLSVIITLRSLTTAVFSVILAKLINKIEIRWIMSTGVLVCSIMYFLMAYSTELWQFYLNGLLVGIGSCCFSILPVTCILQNWFKDKSGSVTGIAMAFSGIMGALFNPICSSIIEKYSWQTGMLFIATVLLILGLPSTITMRLSDTIQDTSKKERQASLKADPSSFILLAIISALFTIGTCMNSHISPLGISAGHDLLFSAKMVSAAMLGNIFFKLFMGYLCDHIGTFKATVLGAILSAGGIFLLQFAYIPLFAYLASFMYGGVFFCGALGVTMLTRMVSGNESYAEVYSRISVITSITSAVSVSLIGFAYDYLNSYVPIVILVSFAMLSGAMLCMLLSKRIK